MDGRPQTEQEQWQHFYILPYSSASSTVHRSGSVLYSALAGAPLVRQAVYAIILLQTGWELACYFSRISLGHLPSSLILTSLPQVRKRVLGGAYSKPHIRHVYIGLYCTRYSLANENKTARTRASTHI